MHGAVGVQAQHLVTVGEQAGEWDGACGDMEQDIYEACILALVGERDAARADLERCHAALCAAERGERDEDHYR
jgi:hypothetical protein